MKKKKLQLCLAVILGIFLLSGAVTCAILWGIKFEQVKKLENDIANI